jgi:hypothetical protein
MVDSVYGADTNLDAMKPVDPMVKPAGAASRSASGMMNTAANAQSSSPFQEQLQDIHDSRNAEQGTMDQVADDTGGKAFYSTNGIQQAIEAAVEQGSAYYMFSYSPDNVSFDGKFRKLRVSLARKGYHLAYRPGYYADLPEAPIRNSKELARAIGLHGMEHRAPESHQLVFAVRIVPVGKPVTGTNAQATESVTAPQKRVDMQHYAIDYAIAGPQLVLTPNGESRRAILDFIVSAFNNDGSVATRAALQTTRDLKPAAYQDMIIGGLRMHQEVDVPVNAVSLRLGVLDELSRHLGTLELPLPLKAPPDDPATQTRRLPPIEPD